MEYYFICDFGGYVYQSLDYTGTGLSGTSAGSPGGYPYASEFLSPKIYRRGGAEREFYVRLRPYRSNFGALYAETDQLGLGAPISMMLTGPNEWRAMVPVGATGITNLTWRFKGEGEYFAGTGTASTGAVYWAGLSDVAGGSVPYGGFCVRTNETERLNVTISSGGYAMLTLNTGTLQYMANRAEYQNFNLWPAPLEKFSASNGQIEKQYFLNTFDKWPTNEDAVYTEVFNNTNVVIGVYDPNPFSTVAFWTAGSAKYVSERAFDSNPDASLNARNIGLRLKGGDGALGLGYIYNTVSQLPDGLKKIAFQGRLGQTSDNYDIVYKRGSFTNSNYAVKATAKAVDMLSLSPETPSVSLIAYYSDPGNFYEFRTTQVPDPNATAASPVDTRVHYELYKWINGTPNLLTQASTTLTISGTPLTSVNDGAQVEMRLYNTTTSSTLIRCKFLGTDNVLVWTDSPSPYQSGTYGFVSSECRSSLSSVSVQGTIADAVASGTTAYPLKTDTTANTTATAASWYFPTNRYVVNSSTTPFGIYSVIPAQKLGIYAQTSNYGSGMDATNTVWSLIGQVTISNYTYQTSTITVNSWQSEYVKWQVMGGDADVVVDGLSVYSWHGKTAPVEALASGWTGWKATEAWVVTNTTSEANIVELDHSRANPALAQAVRSELLTNGMGVMEFDYRVIRPPAVITVQYADQLSPNTWRNVSSNIVTSATGWTHVSSYLGTNAPGYFRVLNERIGVYSNAWIDINDVTAWDEPYVSSTSWKVYNAKITNTDTNRVFLDESKACFLNNNPTNDVAPRPQDIFQPFLQSPTLPKGLGTLSFYARPYNTNESATVYVYATTNGWGAPTNQWFLLTQFNNITNRFYQLCTYSPLSDGKELKFIRSINAVQMSTLSPLKNWASAKRVGLEEVVVAEPVLPGFDIVNVRMMLNENNTDYTVHLQPLAGENIDVEARVANQQLTPSNIVMYVTYYIGTNIWGVGNWPAAQTVTRRMHQVDASVDPTRTLYRTRSDNGGVVGLDSQLIGDIKGQDADTVVQYYVHADYMGGIPLTEDQDTFDSPSWYYPVDLNTKYAGQGWSPYYFVYNVPVNAVWINEVNAIDTPGRTDIGGNQYIEIAMPAWLDLSGWSVDLVTSSGYSTKTITIPSGLNAQVAVTNGYAFFVIGNAFDTSGVTPLPKKDYGYLGLGGSMPNQMPGGLRLKRPLGMYEQTVAYDWEPSYGRAYAGTNWAAKDPQKHFVYVGRENNDGSLGRTGSNTLYTVNSTNTWRFPQTWTPGGPNDGQLISINGDNLQPGVSNVFITSVMNLLKGTQNGKRLASYSLTKHVGDSTNIIYRIDDWYRLYSLQVNNSEWLTAGQAAQGVQSYTLQLPNMTNDAAVNASVQLRLDLSAYQSTPDILKWILGFIPEGPLVPSYANKGTDSERTLSMTEQYWLNADPTKTNLLVFIAGTPTKDSGTNLFADLTMSMNGAKQTTLQGGAVLKLQAKASLSALEWVLVRQYSLSDASFDSSFKSRAYVPNPFAVLLLGMNPESCFFRWMIEMNDPRVEIYELINDTEHVPLP